MFGKISTNQIILASEYGPAPKSSYNPSPELHRVRELAIHYTLSILYRVRCFLDQYITNGRFMTSCKFYKLPTFPRMAVPYIRNVALYWTHYSSMTSLNMAQLYGTSGYTP